MAFNFELNKKVSSERCGFPQNWLKILVKAAGVDHALL